MCYILPQLFTNGELYSLTSGDLDLDGKNDPTVLNGKGENVSVLLNDGAGDFTLLAGFWSGTAPSGTNYSFTEKKCATMLGKEAIRSGENFR